MTKVEKIRGLSTPLAILLLLVGYSLTAQTFVYTPPALVDVGFTGSTYFTIKSDLDDSPFMAPHYISASNTREPVGYVRNSRPSVTAKFSLYCPNSILNIQIRGDVNGVEGMYPAQTVPATAIVTYPITQAIQAFPNVVQYYPAYTINWKASFNHGATWVNAGTSVNQLYVTLAQPKPELVTSDTEYRWYQTLVHIGCQKGAGASTINALFASVWDYINDRNVTRAADGAPLKYYNSWKIQNYTTGSLINTKDGQCGAWAHLLLDILKMQGYQSADFNYYHVQPSAPPPVGFYVKNWVFHGNGTSGHAIFPYENRWGTSPPYGNFGPYNWINPEVTDDMPSAGQSQPHPLSRFNNHQFISFNGTYYDPSYGVVYPSKPDLSPDFDNAISAFFAPIQDPFTQTNYDLVQKVPSNVIQIISIASFY